MNNFFPIFWGTRQIHPAQVSLYVASAVKHLKGLGIKAGQRLVICDENSVEYVILLLAIWQIKAVAAPVSPRWPEKTIAAYAAKISAAHLWRTTDIKRIVCFDARHEAGAGSSMQLDLEQEATIVATSGSSGEVKAAVHTWGNHYYSAQGSQSVIPLVAGDRWLLSLPLYHVSGIGIVARCLCSGAALVMAGDDMAVALNRNGITHVSLVATQMQRLISDDKNHAMLRSLKCILLGGSAIPQILLDQSLELGLKVYLTYGLTEMSSQVATGLLTKTGQPCVKVLLHRQLRLASDGEVLVKGETLFKGYVAGQRLHLPLTQDGWFATGDRGRLDAQGCLSISGRKDSMFISGGENIQPEEIEKALLNIDGINEAVVVPKEDGEFGHRPVAFIKFTSTALSEDDLIRHLQNELPSFKIPMAFYPWPQDLMTQSLKISRRDLQKKLPRQ